VLTQAGNLSASVSVLEVAVTGTVTVAMTAAAPSTTGMTVT
jgi:hypothetical protein